MSMFGDFLAMLYAWKKEGKERRERRERLASMNAGICIALTSGLGWKEGKSMSMSFFSECNSTGVPTDARLRATDTWMCWANLEMASLAMGSVMVDSSYPRYPDGKTKTVALEFSTESCRYGVSPPWLSGGVLMRLEKYTPTKETPCPICTSCKRRVFAFHSAHSLERTVAHSSRNSTLKTSSFVRYSLMSPVSESTNRSWPLSRKYSHSLPWCWIPKKYWRKLRLPRTGLVTSKWTSKLFSNKINQDVCT